MADVNNPLGSLPDVANQWGIQALKLQNDMANLALQKQHMDILQQEANVQTSKHIGDLSVAVMNSPNKAIQKANIQRLKSTSIALRNPVSDDYISMITDPEYQGMYLNGIKYATGTNDPQAISSLLAGVQSQDQANVLQSLVALHRQQLGGDTLKDIYGTAGGKQIVENTQAAIKRAAANGDTQSMMLLNQGLQNPSVAMQIPGFMEALAKHGQQGLAQQAAADTAESLTKQSSLPELKAAQDAPLNLVPGASDLYQKIASNPTGASQEERAQLARMANDAKTKESQIKQQNEQFTKGYDAQTKLADDVRTINKDYYESKELITKAQGILDIIKKNPKNSKLVSTQIDRMLDGPFSGKVSVFRNVDAGIAASGGGIYDTIKNTISGWKGQTNLQPDQIQQVQVALAKMGQLHQEAYRDRYGALSYQAQDAAARPQLKEGFNPKVIDKQIPPEFNARKPKRNFTMYDKKPESSASAAKKPMPTALRQAIIEGKVDTNTGRSIRDMAAEQGYDLSGL